MKTFTEAEKLLTKALDECLEDDLSFAPPEREIARHHRFSKAFEEKMEDILEENRKAVKRKEMEKHFLPRYGQVAACVALFLLCTGVIYGVGSLRRESSGSGSLEMKNEAAMDTGILEEAATESPEAEAEVTEEAAEESPEESETVSEKPLPKAKTYCGRKVDLAEEQLVPETLAYVTTLVNCPVLDEENPKVILTIGNVGTEEIRYQTVYPLQVWIDGGWYEVPHLSVGKQELTYQMLEPGMAVDVEVDLLDYTIDYEAQKYRLLTYVNEEVICAEFTFSETFRETMEDSEAVE